MTNKANPLTKLIEELRAEADNADEQRKNAVTGSSMLYGIALAKRVDADRLQAYIDGLAARCSVADEACDEFTTFAGTDHETCGIHKKVTVGTASAGDMTQWGKFPATTEEGRCSAK